MSIVNGVEKILQKRGAGWRSKDVHKKTCRAAAVLFLVPMLQESLSQVGFKEAAWCRWDRLLLNSDDDVDDWYDSDVCDDDPG